MSTVAERICTDILLSLRDRIRVKVGVEVMAKSCKSCSDDVVTVAAHTGETTVSKCR